MKQTGGSKMRAVLLALAFAGASAQTLTSTPTQAATLSLTQSSSVAPTVAPVGISAQCVVTIAGPLSVEGAPAVAMQLASPRGVASDAAGGFYFSDAGSVVRHVYANGSMFLAAGVIRYTGFAGDGGPGTLARLNQPFELASDGAGGVLIADKGNSVIRRLSSNGSITTVAGVALAGNTGGSASMLR